MTQRLNIDIVAKDKSTRALTKVQSGLAKVKGAVFNLQNAFIGLGVGLAVRSLVTTGKEVENLKVRLKFLLKNANEGSKAFDNMAKFASKVPFSLEEISRGSGILATVTDNADDLNNMLKITGNVAAVTGLDFQTTAEQIQRSFSAGIGAADLFREKGVRNMLGFQAGAEVSIEQTVQAFEKVFGAKGRFGRATDELANTFEGTLSMIGDKIFVFKNNILKAGFFEGLKSEFGDMNKFLEDNSEKLDNIARKIGVGLAQAVIKLRDVFILLKDNLDKIVFGFKILIAIPIASTLIKITTAMIGLTKAMLKFSIATSIAKRGLVGLGMLLVQGGAIFVAFKGIDKLLKEVDKSFDELSDKAFSADANDGFVENLEKTRLKLEDIKVSCRAIPTATEEAIKKFRELNSGALKTLEEKFDNIQMTIAEGINSGITKMSEGLARAFVMGEKLSETFANMARTFLVKILSTLIEIVARKTVELAIEKLITKEKEKQRNLSAASGNPLAILSMFTGRASGGSVQKGQPYMVGERGAELFVPNQSGQIQQSARGGNGGSTTVNFNINTVDASGFDELLVRNRGTITALINNAVNERGSKNLI